MLKQCVLSEKFFLKPYVVMYITNFVMYCGVCTFNKRQGLERIVFSVVVVVVVCCILGQFDVISPL